ncbi:MAG: ABC transporter substrate-binding protein, partial [Caldithrix sp.]|nr:ABC transporter substrate-binding protein [Caldithrix sp.]
MYMFYKAAIYILLVILLGACASGQEDTPREQNGQQTVISLSPHLTEIIYALDAEERLLAGTDFCKYPPAAQKKASVGGLLNPNIEKIVTLKPDIIMGVPAHKELKVKLSEFGLKMTLMPNDRIADIYNTIEHMGRLLNIPENARQLIQSIKDSLAYYEEKAAQWNADDVEAMLVIGREAGTTRQVSVIGPRTFIDSLWTLVGGRNVFSGMN